MNSRRAYFLLETERDNDGGYIPCIAEEDEQGYNRTDWNYGTDKALAQECIDELNERMDISQRDAVVIQLSTMR